MYEHDHGHRHRVRRRHMMIPQMSRFEVLFFIHACFARYELSSVILRLYAININVIECNVNLLRNRCRLTPP